MKERMKTKEGSINPHVALFTGGQEKVLDSDETVYESLPASVS